MRDFKRALRSSHPKFISEVIVRLSVNKEYKWEKKISLLLDRLEYLDGGKYQSTIQKFKALIGESELCDGGENG